MKNIYCSNCKKLTNHIPKLDALKDGYLVCEKCSKMNRYCTLLKPSDPSFIKTSTQVKFLEWAENDRCKTYTDKPAVNLSLIMGPFNEYYTWLTTIITEIIEERDNYIKFKTTNSIYELYYSEIYNPTE